jgi:hypothetical protein
VHLDVRRLDADTWEVTGGRRPHRVGRATGCDCEDAERPCKHLLALRLARAGPAIVLALRTLIPPPSEGRRRARQVPPLDFHAPDMYHELVRRGGHA